jgi:hypothetical protein
MGESFERPRISVTISDEMHERRKRLIPWGQEAQIVRFLFNQALDIIEKAGIQGPLAIGAILSGDISILEKMGKEKR